MASTVLAYYEWAQAELHREQIEWSPARPLVGVGEINDDPDRVIMFDGITCAVLLYVVFTLNIGRFQGSSISLSNGIPKVGASFPIFVLFRPRV